ncbi:hypothetical protein [Pelagicoccus mobilis]|uniref:Uncharacterized protein n=1 Tax=Pelagicoccus mobilis TaxID=415221 RepID=A0A934RSI7_9BACT|nr:hypothetical protein [Pelagicoccus mobilis]MBK1876775.1 hypothetical protein [Pelagicoccus mobilis]
MKTSTLTLSVLLLGAAGYAAYLQTEVNRLKASLEANVAVEEPVAEAVAEKEMPDVVEEQVAAAATEDVYRQEPEAAPEPERPSEEERAARRQERMGRMLAAFEDPQMRVDMIERQMNRIDNRYAEFFKTLDLSDDELEVLRTLMAESGVVNWEMRMRGFGAANEDERALVSEERQLQHDVLQGEIAALLGEENAAALQDYTDSLPYRGQVEALASSLSFTDTPLTDVQSEGLVTSIKEVSQSFEYTKDLAQLRGRGMQDLSGSDVSTYFEERAEYDSMVLEAASETLNDAQLAAYAERQLAERERDQRQIEFMLENPDRGRGGPGGGRGGPRGGAPRF